MIRFVVLFLSLVVIVGFFTKFDTIVLYIKSVLLQEPVPKTKFLEDDFIINKGTVIDNVQELLEDLYLINIDKLNNFINGNINRITIGTSLILTVGEPMKLQTYVLTKDKNGNIKTDKKTIILDKYDDVIDVKYKKAIEHQGNTRIYLKSILLNKIKYIDIKTNNKYEFKYDIHTITDDDEKILGKINNFLNLIQIFN